MWTERPRRCRTLAASFGTRVPLCVSLEFDPDAFNGMLIDVPAHDLHVDTMRAAAIMRALVGVGWLAVEGFLSDDRHLECIAPGVGFHVDPDISPVAVASTGRSGTTAGCTWA